MENNSSQSTPPHMHQQQQPTKDPPSQTTTIQPFDIEVFLNSQDCSTLKEEPEPEDPDIELEDYPSPPNCAPQQSPPLTLPHFNLIQQSITVLTRVMPEMFNEEMVNQFYQKLFQKISWERDSNSPESDVEVKEEPPESVPDPDKLDSQSLLKFPTIAFDNPISENRDQVNIKKQEESRQIWQQEEENGRPPDDDTRGQPNDRRGPNDATRGPNNGGTREPTNNGGKRGLPNDGTRGPRGENQTGSSPTQPSSNEGGSGWNHFLDRISKGSAWREELIKPNQMRLCKNVKYDLHMKWNQDFERILLNMYREGSNLTQVREHLIVTYPQHKNIFILHSLKSVFNKIMRMAIKRLRQESSSAGRGVPALVDLEEQLTFNIIYCGGDSHHIRILLAEFFQQPVPADLKVLANLISAINQFAKKGGGIKRSLRRRMN